VNPERGQTDVKGQLDFLARRREGEHRNKPDKGDNANVKREKEALKKKKRRQWRGRWRRWTDLEKFAREFV
jgi:hypothetical protein